MSVLGMKLRVMALEDVLMTKSLLAIAVVMLEGLGALPGAKPTTGGQQTRVRVRRGSAAAHVG
jgi:hypothetical protein